MNLRWFKKDGQMILQAATLTGIDKYGDQVTDLWQDVPTVSEPRKARECWINRFDVPPSISDTIPCRDYAKFGWIKVREVLE